MTGSAVCLCPVCGLGTSGCYAGVCFAGESALGRSLLWPRGWRLEAESPPLSCTVHQRAGAAWNLTFRSPDLENRKPGWCGEGEQT